MSRAVHPSVQTPPCNIGASRRPPRDILARNAASLTPSGRPISSQTAHFIMHGVVAKEIAHVITFPLSRSHSRLSLSRRNECPLLMPDSPPSPPHSSKASLRRSLGNQNSASLSTEVPSQAAIARTQPSITAYSIQYYPMDVIISQSVAKKEKI